MNQAHGKNIDEVSSLYDIPSDVIIHYIHEEWVYPIDKTTLMLDEEDIARIYLINQLCVDFGVNDEAISVILHLIDRLNVLMHK